MTPVETKAYQIHLLYKQEIANRGLRLSKHVKQDLFACKRVTLGYFISAAEKCIELEIDADDYVKDAFSRVSRNQKYLTPKDMIGAAHVVVAWQAKTQDGDRVDRTWRHHTLELTRRTTWLVPDKYKTQEDILYDPIQPFPSYFRVLHPDQIYSDLFEMYAEDAYKELSKDRKMRAYLRTIRGAQMAKFEELTQPFPDRILEGEYNG
jgi:hypothetical protein